jgi:hypothetical protein
VIDRDEAEANPLVHVLVTLPVGIEWHFRFIDSHRISGWWSLEQGGVGVRTLGTGSNGGRRRRNRRLDKGRVGVLRLRNGRSGIARGIFVGGHLIAEVEWVRGTIIDVRPSSRRGIMRFICCGRCGAALCSSSCMSSWSSATTRDSQNDVTVLPELLRGTR